MKRTVCSMLLMFTAFASPLALAADARDQLAGFSNGLQGLDGRFAQQVFDSNGALKEESAGKVALSAPRQFRWEYESPFPQLVVADGDQIWVYDPDLEQVTVRTQSFEEQASPLAVLIDPGELDRQFKVREGGQHDGLDWLVLTPKNVDDAQFSEARLGFSGEDLARMGIVDALGQRTEIRFTQWQRNPAFAAGTFRFTPPAGVDVVGDVLQNAEVIPLKD